MLFFIVITLFLAFIFYDNFQKEKTNLRNTLFLEMKNYSLNHEDTRFETTITKKEKKKIFYTLYEDQNSLYILVPSPNVNTKEMMMIMGPAGMIMVPYSRDAKEVLKVWYPKDAYKASITKIKYAQILKFALFALGTLLLALLAAWYTLRPLRDSLHLLEDFIKDIIHDLNTPLTSILLNLKMMDAEDEEIQSIRTAAQTIEMLHQNLDAYLREQQQTQEQFNLNEVIERYVAFFTPLYDYLNFEIDIKETLLTTNKQSFERIVYNLISNACKYNTSDGNIKISLEGTHLFIRNSSYGVSNPHRVFERFYKESERGLGIGLHIVDKLCKALGIDKKFSVEDTDVIVTLECEEILG